MESNPLKIFDREFLSSSVNLIAGIDEAGRGPLAGPVVAASVIFSNSVLIDGVNDSKKINKKNRNRLFDEIISKSICFGIGIIENNEIDRINILQATLKAMKLSAEALSDRPDIILIDGNKSFYSDIKTETIVKGDAKSFSIAAASIIAKVTRDRIMTDAHNLFPEYDWLNNKGYGTKKHIEAIENFGLTPLHRKSFLSNILKNISV